MSEIKAIDKLRVSEDAAEYQWIRSDYLNQIADEIEAEIADNYMRLPCDADGVPVKPGEQMTDGQKRVDGMGIAKWDVVSVNERAFFDMSNGSHIPMLCHHVKPRTLEDIVQDAIQYGYSHGKAGMDVSEQRDKYADEIRELLKEGGQ